MAVRRAQGPREKALRKDLRGLATLDGVESYAAIAIELARSLDTRPLMPAEEARLTSELRRTIVEINNAATRATAKEDVVDDLSARRAARRAAASDPVRPAEGQ